MRFVHLHVHSNFSLLQGAFSVWELAQAAAGFDMPAVALTDTNGLYGAIEFYKAALEAGIKPVIGAEIVHGDEQCVCLAADRKGYENLCRIVSERRLSGTPHYGPFLAAEAEDAPMYDDEFDIIESVATHCEGLFVLSATPPVLRGLKGRVPDGRLYADVRADSTHSFETDCPSLRGDSGRRNRRQEKVAAAVAEELSIPPVATVNVNFLRPQDRPTHAVLSAIRENVMVKDLKQEGRMLAGPRSFFLPPDRAAALNRAGEEALANSVRIAEQCELEFEPGAPHFPEADLPEGQTAFQRLRQLAYEGARRRYGRPGPEVKKRLEKELGVIRKLGFCHYFLVVHDIVEFARREGIPHVGRGSAANSIVSYCLGVSAVDPLKFDLYFERFLNEYRTDCPDIDLDFCWRRRDEVIDYVYQRYPKGWVAMVATHCTLQARSAFRDVARVMGVPLPEIDRYSRLLPHYSVASVQEMRHLFPEMANFPIDQEPWCSVLSAALKIDGYVRHLGIHLGGMVIGDRPLTGYTALEQSTKGIVVTQYEMHSIEDIGLVKIDLLGQRSLTIVAEAAEAIRANHGVEVDLENLPDGHERTGRLLRAGRTMGCFQIESPGMRQLLQMMQADSLMDVIQGLSLIRPGPSGSGMKEAFIRRMRGEAPVRYAASRLSEVLDSTYGVMLYQEDILRVAEAVAGFSLAEGDELRKIISKKRSEEALSAFKQRFLEGAESQGVERAAAEDIWSQIEGFAAYSYCKAHACTYGHISYQAAWLKAHYPAEFLAGVIANKAGFYPAGTYYRDARRFNVPLLPPCVNRSRVECHAAPGGIRPGLESVKELSTRTIRQILRKRADRPFESLEDFCTRVGPPRPELDNLILCGAFGFTGLNRPGLMMRAEILMDRRSMQTVGGSTAMHRLLAGISVADRPAESRDLPVVPPYSVGRKVALELEILGMTHSGHPLDAWDGVVPERGVMHSYELARRAGQKVTFVGWLVTMRRATTKKHDYMKFLTLEDRHGVVEMVVFPDVYQRLGRETDCAGCYLVEGRVKEQHGACGIVAESVERLPMPDP